MGVFHAFSMSLVGPVCQFARLAGFLALVLQIVRARFFQHFGEPGKVFPVWSPGPDARPVLWVFFECFPKSWGIFRRHGVFGKNQRALRASFCQGDSDG